MNNIRNNSLLVFTLLITCALTSYAQSNSLCNSNSIYQQMDFRLGTWEHMSPSGQVLGFQTVEKILDGCAMQETYSSIDGLRKGSSIIYYHLEDKLWKQTFADNQGNWVEGEGKVVDGKLLFEGKSSRFPMMKWTLEMLSKDQLRDLTEVSYDGHNWEVLGDVIKHLILPAHPCLQLFYYENRF